MLYTYMGILYSLKKEDLAICDSLDRHGGHRDKGNQPDTEGQTLNNLPYMWNLNKSNL